MRVLLMVFSMRPILCDLDIGLYNLSLPGKDSQDVKQGHRGRSKSGTIKINMGFSRNGEAATVRTNAERGDCTCVASALLQPTFVVPRLSCPSEVILCDIDDGDTGHGKPRFMRVLLGIHPFFVLSRLPTTIRLGLVAI